MREITNADMTLARNVARRYGPAEDGDLESAAMAGLLEAAEKFDGRGDWKAYALQRMKWRVIDTMRRTHDIPVDPFELYPDDVAEEEPQEYPYLHEALEELGDLGVELLEGIDKRKTQHQMGLEFIRNRMDK